MNTQDKLNPITNQLKDVICIHMDNSAKYKTLLDSYKKRTDKVDPKTNEMIGYLSDVVVKMDVKIQEAFEQLESIENNYDSDNFTQSLRDILDFSRTKIKGLTHLESQYATTNLLLSARLIDDKYQN